MGLHGTVGMGTRVPGEVLGMARSEGKSLLPLCAAPTRSPTVIYPLARTSPAIYTDTLSKNLSGVFLCVLSNHDPVRGLHSETDFTKDL